MDRLTIKLHEGCYGVSACKTGCEHENKHCGDAETTCPSVRDCFDKLGRLEDLEESGRLAILPEELNREKFLENIAVFMCPGWAAGLPDWHETDACSHNAAKDVCKKCWREALKGDGENE